ncbi:Fumagillin beta-trans-bergamotene synthase [Cladobotryum mycophilum]|uniref:Fumagillin beta-trans-bergamotene synthase n=1 Tax=Cladobotryum mycophilum TaxID=491253 RepID=A0ABR0SIK4_9HYPO
MSTITLYHDLSWYGRQQTGHINLQHLLHRLAYQIYSIWLFTFSDIKTIIAPSLMFALFTAPAMAVFGASSASRTSDLLRQVPLVVLWLWINLLPFTIDNQRQPESIVEDRLNKPWRTMPSKRMTPAQARSLMFCLYPLALLTSLKFGGIEQCLSLMALGLWYNDLRGADRSCIVRNLINAAGFNRFTTGALEVLLEEKQHYGTTRGLIIWQAIVAGIVFTTVQTQDMYDQLGDAQRCRRTVPLVIGDDWSRWSIAVPMVFWSIFCPVYIGSPLVGFAISAGLGGLVAVRSLLKRSVPTDKMTFRLWNLWLVSIYTLPLLKVMWIE